LHTYCKLQGVLHEEEHRKGDKTHFTTIAKESREFGVSHTSK
jgi:hypothetical protein